MTLYVTPWSKRRLRRPVGSPYCGRLVAIEGSVMPRLSGVCARNGATLAKLSAAITAQGIGRPLNFIETRAPFFASHQNAYSARSANTDDTCRIANGLS